MNGGSAAAPVRVPGDGSPVTVPAGSAFVAELGSVSVEGGPGVFAQATEVRVSHTALGARQHSRFETTAAQPVLLDFGGAEPAAPLTVRFQTVRPGLEAGHVIPAVWDSELSAWVPTIDEVTVTDNEIIVRTAARSSLAAAGPAGAGGVTVAAAGPAGAGGVTVAVAGTAPPPTAALPSPCSWWGVSWGCGAVNKVVTVFVPAAWRHTEDAARALIGGAVDVAHLSADAVVATARQYLPKVMRAIEAGVAAGLEAGVAFYERWLLPALDAIFELRAHPPVCSATTPEWAREGIDFSDTDRRDPRVHLCSQATPDGDLDGDLHVKAVNNRNFGFQVTPSDGASYENFTAPRPPDISVGSLLTNKLNGFLIDNVEALGGYQWPLSAASFDVARFEPAHRSDWTAQWLVNVDTATTRRNTHGRQPDVTSSRPRPLRVGRARRHGVLSPHRGSGRTAHTLDRDPQHRGQLLVHGILCFSRHRSGNPSRRRLRSRRPSNGVRHHRSHHHQTPNHTSGVRPGATQTTSHPHHHTNT